MGHGKRLRWSIGKSGRWLSTSIAVGRGQSLFLFAHPDQEFSDFRVSGQGLDRVVVTAQIFFVRNQSMDRAVAIAAQADGFPHLLARESLLEPLVGMARPRDEMVFGGAAFGQASAKAAGLSLHRFLVASLEPTSKNDAIGNLRVN